MFDTLKNNPEYHPDQPDCEQWLIWWWFYKVW